MALIPGELIRFDRLTGKPKIIAVRSKPFIAGPLPQPSFDKTVALPGKAVTIALELWFLRAIQKSQTVIFKTRRLRRLGVSERVIRRGLRALEKARLISIHWEPGQLLKVKIHEAERLDTGGEFTRQTIH